MFKPFALLSTLPLQRFNTVIIINNNNNLITYIALVYIFLSKALYRYNEIKNYAFKYVQKLVIINEK